MPKISRIRIINFSYNGDKRLILDELFNLHQGEDALISLKNGGGKSVLVQALMQPILPNLSLQKRKMSDFFVRKKQPAYILIEWKLDEDGGYLLTGIAMMNKESTLQEQEEGAHAVRYFTFTTNYKQRDALDIMHIQLTTKEKNRVLVKNYGETQRMIQDARKSRGGSVAYYSENEKKDYQRHLESFNIHPDEWRTVLFPINSEEGGLIKIFEKCRTPRLLLKDWILKTVNKVIFDDQEESQSLMEMMGNLAQSMIDNESFILERDLLKGFSDRMKTLSEAVCKAAGTHGERLEKEMDMRSLEQFLHVELGRLAEKKKETEIQMDDKKKELHRIEQEKVSEDYYTALESYEKSRLKAEELEKEYAAVQEKLKKLQHDIDVLEARGIYEEVQRLLREKAGIETELLRLREPSEDLEMMDKIAYSLKVAFEEKIREIEDKLLQRRNSLMQLLERKEEIRKEESFLRDDVKKAIKVRQEYTGHILNFERDERELHDRFGISIQRNLLQGLDEKTAGIMLDMLRKDVELARGDLESLEKKKADALKKEDAILEEIPRIQIDRNGKESELKRLRGDLKDFEKKEEELLNCMNRYDISQTKRFQKEYLLTVFKELMETGQGKLDSTKDEIQSLEKRKSAMEKGILHVSQEFFDHLRESGIEFDTGEHYLQKQSMEIRSKLLKSIPLLPYAFLMTEVELEKLKYHLPAHPLLQPVPVITYGSLETDEEVGESLVIIGKGKMILCVPDLRLFETEGVDDYKAELDKRLQEEKESRKHYEAYLKELRDNERLISSFSYPETYYKETKRLEEALEQVLIELQERAVSLQEERNEIRILRGTLEKQKDLLWAKHEESEKKLRKAEAHLAKNKDYEQHLQARNELEKKMEGYEKRLQGLAEEEVNLDEDSSDLNKEIWSHEEDQKKMSREKERFDRAEEKSLEEGTLDELLEKYSKYQEKLTGNMERLEQDLTLKVNELKSREKKLLNSGVSQEEYQEGRYLESEGYRLASEKKKIEVDQDAKATAFRVIRDDTSRLSGICENKREELKNRGITLLPPEEIHGSYKERTAECTSSVKKLEELRRNLERTLWSYGDIREKIGEKLRNSRIKVSVKVWAEDRDVEKGFKVVSEELLDLSSRLSEEKVAIQQSYWKLRDDYKEKNHSLTTILYNLEKKHDAAERDPENYYYLFEYIENQLEGLGKRIRIQEMQLENMEKSFHDTVMQSYNLAKEIYDHVNRVADDSSIQLEGKNRKVKMIEIILRELEPEEKGFEAMKLYIRERADEVKDQLKNGKTRKDVKDMISKFMSSEELLNVISDLSDLRIKAYKVDINAKHSQAKDWEKVMRENSGGERFVSFFAVMIALMSYARNSRRTTEDYDRKNTDTKVLLMDNPFGPISSDHLLKPLFDIAEKYKTQLICLTDLKQNSIMNQFKVIFMMKIVPNTTGTMEYLKVEESSYVGEDNPVEENLEMLNYYQEEEQISLLGDDF